MSLKHLEKPKTYKIAIFTSKALEDSEFISNHIGDKVQNIEHIYTNGASSAVADFATTYGIPYTIYPIAVKGLPWSISNVLDNVVFTYIFADNRSKSSIQIENECGKRKIKYLKIEFEAAKYYKEKIEKIGGILSVIPEEEKSNWYKQIEKIV